MSEIDRYVSEVRMMSRAAFIASNPNPFLLLKLDDREPMAIEGAPQKADDDWAGTTRMTRVLGKTGSFAVLRHNAALYRIHKLVPADPARIKALPDNDASETKLYVNLGRTPENDIAIAETAISKVHARFLCDFRGDWQLMDCGSRNGTSVNGKRLVPEQPTPVSFGDPIAMGGLVLMIIGAGALYEIVASQLPGGRSTA